MFARTAIVGVGQSDYPALYRDPDPTRAAEDLALEATERALADAGLDKSEIDGLVTSGVSRYEPFMFRAGLQDVRFLAHPPPSGRMASAALAHAAMAVLHGLARYVLLFHVVRFRSQKQTFGGDAGIGAGQGALGDLYDEAFGMTSPGAFYALAFTRYQEMYGGTEEDLAEIPMTIRRHASLNPNAIMREPFTLEQYLETRYIARPLRLLDYCLVNDGAVAYIVTTAERARDLAQPPVLVGSVAQRANVREWYVAEDFWTDACRSLRRDLLDEVGLGLADISSLQAYDNFSPSVIWMLEGLGFAPRGEGLQWIKGGRIAIGGELPVNTSGGLLSESYLQGWNNHVEAVLQLRGQAGERQIPDCRAVLYCCLSAVPGGDVLVRDA